MTEPRNGPESVERGTIADDVARRVHSVVSMAEQLADCVRRDAERRRLETDHEAERRLAAAREEADQIVADQAARLSVLSQELAVRADAVFAEIEAAEAARDRLRRSLTLLGQTNVALGRLAGEETEDSAGKAPLDSPRGPADAHEGQDPPQSPPSADDPSAGVPEARLEPRQSPPEAGTAPAETSEGRSAPPGNGGGPRMTPRANSPPDRSDSLEAARLVAFQMAIAGSTRAEVAGHLSRTFGVSDPQSILDEAFGSAERPEAPPG